MNISEPFIRRPIATTLIAIGILLAGVVAFPMLPIAPLPQVDFPTIQVSASLPGASAETVAAGVTTPLERQFSLIAGVTELTSTSSLGSAQITIQFDLDRDIDAAAGDVQSAINAASAQLPTNLSSSPSYRKVNPADSPVLLLGLTSETLPLTAVDDAADTVLAQQISQLTGVAQVAIGGAQKPAIRIQLDPAKIASLGLSLEDVRAQITQASADAPKGTFDGARQSFAVYDNDQLLAAGPWNDVILAYRKGAPIRVKDIGQAVDGPENTKLAAWANDKRGILLSVFKQPGANVIDTVNKVRAALPQLQATIPAGIEVTIIADRTETIRASVDNVEGTLITTIFLVVAVIFVFLRSAWATIIPGITVPLSLAGCCAVMYALGYSLDNLSLMALSIAVGFVVDDAIVMLENIVRHIEEGMTPFDAALKGAGEIGFTIISISLSLVAVFIPLLLMGGIVGRLFREFAITLSVAILVSLVISLTLTPMMCARLLRVKPGHGPAGDGTPGTRRSFFARVGRGYERSLQWALSHSFFMMLLLGTTICVNIYLYVAIPKSFFPQQDTGMIQGFVQADQSISFQALQPKVEAFAEIVRRDPAVATVSASIGGGGGPGGGGGASGSMFVALKPLRERKVSADVVINRLRLQTTQVTGAQLFLNSNQDLRAGGRQSSATYQFTLQADELDELRTWEPKIRNAIANLPELTDVNTDAQEHGLESRLVYDRDTISRLGLTIAQIDSALYDSFGQRQVSTLYKSLNQYHVIMEVSPQFWQGPEALKSIYVIAANGSKVPLSAFAHYEMGTAALSVSHQGQFVASTISFNLADGVSLSQATEAINHAMANLGVPTSVHGSFQGSAKLFQQALDNQPLLILAALVAVYIVLGVLYESYIHPITILSTLPSAGVGALLALQLFGQEFSIIALIGVLLLIGIVKKNAIMMIDFAITAERTLHLSPHDAISRACVLRFRPIMMTTMAALLGALPLAIGGGEGSELRRPLGIAIVGGLLFSQALTLYTTPVVYLYFDRLRLWLAARRGAPHPSAPAAVPASHPS